jgi:hypothetical protein
LIASSQEGFKKDFKRREGADRFKMCSSQHHQLAEGDTSASSEQSINLRDMINLSGVGNSKGSNLRFQKWLEAAEFHM